MKYLLLAFALISCGTKPTKPTPRPIPSPCNQSQTAPDWGPKAGGCYQSCEKLGGFSDPGPDCHGLEEQLSYDAPHCCIPGPKHVDPMSFSIDQLRNFRGDFGGIYIPEIKPACPEDPTTHIKCNGNPKGLIKGAFFTPSYGVYTEEQRKIIRYQYTKGLGVDGNPRNYTHFPLNVFCDPHSYGGLYPLTDCTRVNEFLHELWDDGIIPVCFLLPDEKLTSDLSNLDKSLCRIVVPMWEMDGPLKGNALLQSEAILYARKEFPNALIYGHWTNWQSGAIDPGAPWWNWFVKDAPFPMNDMKGFPNPKNLKASDFPNPHATGILMQTPLWEGVPETIERYGEMLSRLGGGLNGWPAGTDVVLFESDIYDKFWQARSEMQSIKENNQVLSYMNKPFCDGSHCGTIRGFCSGSTLYKQ